MSPDGLRGAEWIRAAYPFELGGLPVAWQLSARARTDAVMTEWTAYFTEGVPHEALTDLVVEFDARAEPGQSIGEAERVLSALSARGWPRDIDRPNGAATDPSFSTTFSLETVPSLVHDADPRDDLLGWQAWAEPVPGATYLWCASFSPSTPPDLVAAFASSLASSVPVRRRTLPEPAAGHLTVVRAI
ncbi:DUF317 domain-containing protein [Actinacidiphila sp. bgisy144]|uniref:DUF317 domain-containing protein n=1 Tax=Actinacidiphila sp. bgisy144 TaxID=3413791 RepID=UPI003EBF6D3F